MGMTVDKGFFQTKDEVFEDMRKTGYWPSTYISPASGELPVHWHNLDVVAYVMAGETYMLDENGKRYPLEPGDRLNLPAGALHAEGAVKDSVTYIVTVSECVPLMEALSLLDPAKYPEPTPLEMAG